MKPTKRPTINSALQMFQRVPMNRQRAIKWATFSTAASLGLTIGATAINAALPDTEFFSATTKAAGFLGLIIMLSIPMSIAALMSAVAFAHLTNQNDLRRLNIALAVLTPVGASAASMLTIENITLATAAIMTAAAVTSCAANLNILERNIVKEKIQHANNDC